MPVQSVPNNNIHLQTSIQHTVESESQSTLTFFFLFFIYYYLKMEVPAVVKAKSVHTKYDEILKFMSIFPLVTQVIADNRLFNATCCAELRNE